MPEPRDPDLVQIIARLDRDGGELQRQVDARWGRVPLLAADPASPPSGGIWIRSDTGALRYKANGTTMSTAGGRIGGALVVVDQAGITVEADLTSFTVTFTAVAGRRYTAWYTFGATQLTAIATQTFRIYSDGGLLGIIDSTSLVPVGSTRMVSGFWEIGTLTAASHIIKLTGATTAGTLTIPSASAVNGRYAIYDVGT